MMDLYFLVSIHLHSMYQVLVGLDLGKYQEEEERWSRNEIVMDC